MNQIFIVSFLLSSKLCLEDLVTFSDDIKKQLADVEFLDRIFFGKSQHLRVDLTDKGQDSAGVFIRLNG